MVHLECNMKIAMRKRKCWELHAWGVVDQRVGRAGGGRGSGRETLYQEIDPYGSKSPNSWIPLLQDVGDTRYESICIKGKK